MMTLTQLIQAVRDQTGWQEPADVSDARITRAINFIYTRLIPNELKWRKFKVWGFIDLVDGTGSYNILTTLKNTSGGTAYGTRVIAIEPPVFLQVSTTLTDPLGFTYDRASFWKHYPPLQTESELQPQHVLCEGYTLHFRPVPDAAYVATLMVLLRPAELALSTDQPVEDWCEAIAAGAAAAVFTEDEEENAGSLWQVCSKFLEVDEQADYMVRNPRLKERW